MKNIISYRNFLVAALLVLSLSACAAITGRESAGEYVDDATITADVKAEILAEPSLKMGQISVETFKGIVQLRGFVDSAEKVRKAGEIARNTPGIKAVKNNIIVKK